MTWVPILEDGTSGIYGKGFVTVRYFLRRNVYYYEGAIV